jgi:hypothetical protein
MASQVLVFNRKGHCKRGFHKRKRGHGSACVRTTKKRWVNRAKYIGV